MFLKTARFQRYFSVAAGGTYMTRKVLGVGLFCVLLLAAIIAGYWDMLNTEKLTLVRDRVTNAVGEIGDVVRSDPAPSEKPATPPDVPSSDTASAAKAPRVDGDAASGASTPAAAPAADTAAASPSEVAQQAAPGSDTPSFDVLRVEPDGSTVLAGKAPAGAVISLRDGATVIGTEVADAAGTFVVILEKPLGVGDHQIQIEAKTADGRVVTSPETAIVSIPEKGRESELLALVESPDKPSRLISLPSAPGAAAPAGTPSAPAETPAQAAAPATAPNAAAGTAPAAVPDASVQAAGAATAPSLAVDAIEIEGDAVFVAGRSVGSASVRVYVDNGFLSQADRLADDRFLMTAKAKLATGDHTVRADALDRSGTVIARVEVPFFKPEGRSMSAVSPTAETAGTAAPAPASATPTSAPPSSAMTASDSDKAGRLGRAPSAEANSNAPAGTLASPSSPQALAAAPTATTSGQTGMASALPEAVVPAAPLDAGQSAVAVTRQPALEGVNSRVIIRRGDSLWRISRDTYGRGARYTVIYLANGDQIRDPDRIYPGQVFRMPKDETPAQ